MNALKLRFGLSLSVVVVSALVWAGCSLQQNTPTNPTGTSNLATPLRHDDGNAKRISGQYIVTLKDNVQDDEVDYASADISGKHGGERGYVYHNAMKGFSVTLQNDNVDELLQDSRVQSVEPDFEVQATTQQIPWGEARIGATVSSTIAGDGTGSVNGVDIYIIDTGIDLTASDLNVVENVTFVKRTKNGNDDNGHGTHCAGIAAAKDNYALVVGAAPGARLHAVKVLDKNGSGSFSTVIAGVDWVTKQKLGNPTKLMVASMSLGAAVGTTTYNSLDNAVLNSINAGVVYTVAAGNNGADAATFSPAHVKEALTVAAYDQNNVFASWSNYGTVVDVCAPGVSILSTWPGNRTATLSGTSMATPHVAGAAALFWSGHPTATASDVMTAITASASASNPVPNASITGVPVNTTTLSVYEGGF